MALKINPLTAEINLKTLSNIYFQLMRVLHCLWIEMA